MADHTIKFTLPQFELAGQDVVFAVFIDGHKQGELHLSEGGVDWWPRSAKKLKNSKTWSQLRDFMEG